MPCSGILHLLPCPCLPSRQHLGQTALSSLQWPCSTCINHTETLEGRCIKIMLYFENSHPTFSQISKKFYWERKDTNFIEMSIPSIFGLHSSLTFPDAILLPTGIFINENWPRNREKKMRIPERIKAKHYQKENPELIMQSKIESHRNKLN